MRTQYPQNGTPEQRLKWLSNVTPKRGQCAHCSVIMINGVRCHEHGCPTKGKG